ncbi:GatB/YqeY domain-containing protein [Mesosutterella sp. AGMB02718]|uniref:GatB/YqeY domain-containing protein n=1 Tax=Mesosutterella faecium TaxID=2925194 RepID=A0ABT7IJE5_9BURK|nr:GatB/YqeY domain-containing protein [Mesosutterella sp. AGMB02718]MDL2058489.1 GatB/YqeY domain-containing protein [Mesosutterella sp. AGMB02718]
MALREQIQSDMKDALRAHDSARLNAIRMLWSAVKQKEVDERVTADDAIITALIAKAVKEHRDSVAQYEKGGRQDLVDKENFEIKVLTGYLPKPLTEDEVKAVIDEAIAKTGASGLAGMGRVMGAVKPRLTGRTDMSRVSALVRERLTAGKQA